MAKFNPNKIKAFQDFLELQNELKSAQSSYESVKSVEQISDAFFGMGLVAGVQIQKLALVGMLLAGGVYLYNNKKKEVSSSRTGRRYVDYSRRPKKPSYPKYEEVKSNAK